MLNTYKKYLVMIMFVLLSLGVTNGFVFAYSTQITLDAREDAGQYPGQPAFLNFLSNGTEYPGPATDPGWTHYIHHYDGDPRSVDTYAYNAGIPGSWRLESAGNVWSSDKIVGESLVDLHAGTYRVSPICGAFMYSFADDPVYGKYWWQLSIRAQNAYVNGQLVSDFSTILGSTNPYTSAEEALNANTAYLDITLAEGGSLSFWIWDWNDDLKYGNSIDNSGSLTFNVASVPEPSTFLLLTMGLAFLMRRLRR